MSQTPGRKLKVFQAQIGFHDTVVAAPSRTAALAAWGTHQNLFTTGDARIAADPAAVAAALQHPGIPLRRAMGSNDAFLLEPASLPKLPAAAKNPRLTGKGGIGNQCVSAPIKLPAKTKTLGLLGAANHSDYCRASPKFKPQAPARRTAERTALTAAEAALRDLDTRRKQEEADLRRAEKSLAEQRAAAQKAYVEARKHAVSNLEAAQEKYRKAGGTD